MSLAWGPWGLEIGFVVKGGGTVRLLSRFDTKRVLHVIMEILKT